MNKKPKHKLDKRAEALKANLARRKDQERAKKAGTRDSGQKDVDGDQ